MNAQSTPVRKMQLRSRSRDSFSEITPIKKSKLLQNQVNNISSSSIDQQLSENVVLSNLHKSRVKKKESLGETSHKKRFSYDLFKEDTFDSAKGKSNVSNSKNDSNDLGSLANMCSEIKEMFKDPFSNDTGCFLSDELISDSKLFQVIDSCSKINENGNNNINDFKDSSPIEFQVKKKVNENNSEILTVSDVMKWTDQSFLPKNNSMNLSNEIKQKLLDNVSNQELVKSQTTGWTQLNSSFVSKVIEQDGEYEEMGPFYGLPLAVKKLYEEHKDIKELYCNNMISFLIKFIFYRLFIFKNV